MKTKFSTAIAIASQLSISLALLTSADFAVAGPRVGNGGAVWVCQADNNGPFRWIELVDLFEAKNEYGLQLLATTASDPWKILQARVDFINTSVPSITKLLTLTPEELRAKLTILPNGSSLTRIADGFVRVLPAASHCAGGVLKSDQLANYTFDGRLLIAGDLWTSSSFSNLGRAALLMHEIVYKSLRDRLGDTSSSRARAIVGLIFSNLSPQQIDEKTTFLLNETEAEIQAPPVLKSAFRLDCSGRIGAEENSAGSIAVEFELLASTTEQAQKLENFVFTVNIDSEANRPLGLTITDAKSGAKASLEGDTVTAIFNQEAKVSLSLATSGPDQVATLECQALPVDSASQ